ncbi:Thioesterase/thiol ester dehydrase-isomerase [Obba rivulosa]|uniref:Thioesterase/thiol ester dehydrase-isomerase n=1 Tax=Obba rivulosa TaxID=1052685 RepID=A0A8E2DLM6_9APHY|nr:Thioesterase/thiol ester dehydrase-isomerase [Obba rivulosa]
MLTTVLRRGTTASTRLQLHRHLPRRFASTSADTPASSSKLAQALRRLLSMGSVAAAAYTLGSLYPPQVATFISPRPAPPPLHPDDPAAASYVQALENELQNLPLLNARRAQPDADEWYEARPFANLPEERRVNSLTAGALRGPGKLALPPLTRARRDEKEAWHFVHVGRALCGHEGIVHGGLLATLLDESLARVALLNLPEKIGVTATLDLSYRAPTRADQFIVIKTRLVEARGRKARVEGTIEDLQGTVLVEAKGLFIQPKYAKLLNTQQIRQVLGEPSDSREPITEGAVAPVPVTLPGGAPAMGQMSAKS